MITVAFINQSTVLTDDQLTPVIAALMAQVSRDFAPYWGVDAKLVQVCKKPNPKAIVAQVAVPPPVAFWLLIANTSDYAGAAGYHDVTPEGMPLGKAFVKSDVDAGLPWSVTVSHELLEMLADPDISRVVEYRGTKKTVFFALEVCDPCEDNSFAYGIGQIFVSDFVLPGWYHAYRNYPFYDFAKRITKPLQILAGGYQSVFDPTLNTGWRDVGPDQSIPTGPHSRQRVGSRRERRGLPFAQLQATNLPFELLACDKCGNQVGVPRIPGQPAFSATCQECSAAEAQKKEQS